MVSVRSLIKVCQWGWGGWNIFRGLVNSEGGRLASTHSCIHRTPDNWLVKLVSEVREDLVGFGIIPRLRFGAMG